MQVRSEEFSDMLDLLLQIGKGTTLREAEATIMSACCDIVKCDRSDLYVYEHESNVLRSRTRVGRSATDHEQLASHEIEMKPEMESVVGYVYLTGEIVSIPKRNRGDECDWDLSFINEGDADDVLGFIAAPVFTAEEEVQGVILVFNKSTVGESFTEHDVFSIEQISRIASNAFKTWESIYEAQHAKQRMETLVGMIKHISNETDTNMVIDKMFQMSRSILNAEGITLFELIQSDDLKIGDTMLRISKSTRGDAIGMTFSVSEGIAGHVARTGELLNIKDANDDSRHNSNVDKQKKFQTRSLLCVPVFQHGRVVAVIQAINKRTGKYFSEDDEHLLQYLSESTGISLSQAALFNQVLMDRRQAQVDKIFIQVLSKRCSTHKFVTNVMAAAKVLLDMERFSLYLVDHHHHEVWVTVEEENIICVPIGVGIAGHVAETGEVLNIVDAYEWPGFNKNVDKKTGFRTKSVLCMPVTSDGIDQTIIGVVQCMNRMNNRGEVTVFDENDVKLLHQFCLQLSVVMRQMMMEAAITKMNVDRKSETVEKSSSAAPVFSLAKQYRTDLESEQQFGNASALGWSLKEDHVIAHNDETAHIIQSVNWDLDTLAMNEGEMMHAFEVKLEQFCLLENHDIESSMVQTFITKVKDTYRDNAYHNFHHAFHVFHSVQCILRSKSIGYLNSFQVLSVLLAAICHDIDHPGHNNAFETATLSELAILYSDDSVLERHHAAVTFRILKEEDCNVLQNMNPAEFAQCRRIIIHSILATDMKEHTELSRKLALLPANTFNEFGMDTQGDVYSLFFSVVLHTGDLSGQALPLNQALCWGEKVISEFAMQAKKEEALNLPVAPFMMNANDPIKAAGVQKGYIDFILKPWWVQFVRFFDEEEDIVKGLEYVNEVRKFYVGASQTGDEKDTPKREIRVVEQLAKREDGGGKDDSDQKKTV